MRTQALIIVAILVVSSCAGPAEPAAPAKEAASYVAHGLEVDRPAAWEFIPPDSSVVPDTVVVLQGPIGDSDLRPSVEISRRSLSAADRKRKPAHLLTALTLEIVQTFTAFDAMGEPQDMQIAGLPGAMMRMNLTEMLPDGVSVERSARFYVAVGSDDLWVIRCFGPADESAAPAFDAIVASLRFAG
jgi:hypothetical protein